MGNPAPNGGGFEGHGSAPWNVLSETVGAVAGMTAFGLAEGASPAYVDGVEPSAWAFASAWPQG